MLFGTRRIPLCSGCERSAAWFGAWVEICLNLVLRVHLTYIPVLPLPLFFSWEAAYHREHLLIMALLQAKSQDQALSGIVRLDEFELWLLEGCAGSLENEQKGAKTSRF